VKNYLNPEGDPEGETLVKALYWAALEDVPVTFSEMARQDTEHAYSAESLTIDVPHRGRWKIQKACACSGQSMGARMSRTSKVNVPAGMTGCALPVCLTCEKPWRLSREK
jgi:hypothetical protein